MLSEDNRWMIDWIRKHGKDVPIAHWSDNDIAFTLYHATQERRILWTYNQQHELTGLIIWKALPEDRILYVAQLIVTETAALVEMLRMCIEAFPGWMIHGYRATHGIKCYDPVKLRNRIIAQHRHCSCA